MTKPFIILMCGVFLTGCSGLIPMPTGTPRRFILEALPPPASLPIVHHKKGAPHVIIDPPMVSSYLDTQRLVIQKRDHEVDYYADVEWADRLGALIQDAMVASFQNIPGLTATTQPATTTAPSYRLATQVRSFHIKKEDGQLVAVVDYVVYLTSLHCRRVEKTYTLTQRHPIAQASKEEVINGLNNAHRQALEQLRMYMVADLTKVPQ